MRLVDWVLGLDFLPQIVAAGKLFFEETVKVDEYSLTKMIGRMRQLNF
ncbi:hypothetical protein [Flavobacterium sp.]|nr:hypothetical protein [Flavobacterium sp.]